MTLNEICFKIHTGTLGKTRRQGSHAALRAPRQELNRITACTRPPCSHFPCACYVKTGWALAGPQHCLAREQRNSNKKSKPKSNKGFSRRVRSPSRKDASPRCRAQAIYKEHKNRWPGFGSGFGLGESGVYLSWILIPKIDLPCVFIQCRNGELMMKVESFTYSLNQQKKLHG